MPVYVYERPDGSRFEIRQGFTDDQLMVDPETGVPVRRILQPAPIIFKGAGFYKTDSRGSSGGNTPEVKKTEGGTADAASSDAAPASSSDAKAESKPETKSTETKSADAPTKPSTEGKAAADKTAKAAS